MELKVLIEAVGTLGMPVAVTVFLIWHFVRINRVLSDHNEKLLDELSRLRQCISETASHNGYNEKLLKQNEQLVQAIQQHDQDSLELVRLMVDVQVPQKLRERESVS